MNGCSFFPLPKGAVTSESLAFMSISAYLAVFCADLVNSRGKIYNYLKRERLSFALKNCYKQKRDFYSQHM